MHICVRACVSAYVYAYVYYHAIFMSKGPPGFDQGNILEESRFGENPSKPSDDCDESSSKPLNLSDGPDQSSATPFRQEWN